MIPEPESAESTASLSHKRLFLLTEKKESRNVCVWVYACVRVCVHSAGFRQRPEHVDIKALLINTIRFSWELRSAFRVQDWGAWGSAAACALLFARWLFPTSSPLNCSVLSCSRREKKTHTHCWADLCGLQGIRRLCRLKENRLNLHDGG